MSPATLTMPQLLSATAKGIPGGYTGIWEKSTTRQAQRKTGGCMLVHWIL